MQSNTILLGHGSGGKLSHDLIDQLIVPRFANPTLEGLGDSAILDLPGTRLAFTTDSYVVQPIQFPGGDIGKLAVCGTVNDLAVAGATPLYLSCGLILEEGLDQEILEAVLDSMQQTASAAGVHIVTGDTKVVDRGSADRIFINTAGIGIVDPACNLGFHQILPGDKILLSGTIGDHGVAVLAKREGIGFESTIQSDCAPLNGLIESVLSVGDGIRFLRDPTRGGIASTLKEIALSTGHHVWADEGEIPVSPPVRAACELLGLDPIYIANEGKVLAVVASEDADSVLEAMRQHPLGQQACIIGEIREQPAEQVHFRTSIGGTRIVDMLVGDQLPRIC